jgi:N-acetylglucosaminyldiphosphoundecaprenol N-acetyl-beta-D-mannosaminyltransferase/alpha-1,3-mannosyltransferase
MKHRLPVISILGIPVVRATEAEAMAEIGRLAEDAPPALLAYVNAHTLELSARDSELRRLLREDAAMVLNDGIGVSIAAKMVGKETFPANLNGTDLTPKILELAAAKGWRVFLFGAAPGVAEKAAAKFAATVPGLAMAGTRNGFFTAAEEPGIIQQIRDAGTDVLVVGMGNPKQEKWLKQHLASSGAKIGVGVGAFLDFSAGVFPRAPMWIQKIKLEWLYRMSREPKRLWKRYLLGGPLFLARVALSKLGKKK